MIGMSLYQRFIYLSFAFLVVLTFDIVLVDFVSSDAGETVERFAPVTAKAQELKLSVVQVQQYLSDIGATRGLDGLNDGFQKAEEYAQRFAALVGELKRLDPANVSQYEALLGPFEQYYRVGKTMAQAYIDKGPEGGNKLMGQFDETAVTMAKKADELVNRATSDLTEHLVQQDRDQQRIQIAILVSALLMGGIVFSNFLMMRGALQVLPRVGREMEKIAAGDIRPVDLGVNRQDEIGTLVDHIARMKRGLQETIADVSQAANLVFGTVADLSKVAQLTEQGMATQQDQVHRVATAMTEMSATANEIARSADNARESVNDANGAATEGQRVVVHTVNMIGELANEVRQAAEVIAELKESSESIGTIVDVIREIAEQTNLLALNAAIEAARAGEQGRGFAVVADEVRTLAQRTQKSTEEIQVLIEKLQSTAHNAVHVMDKGQKQASASVDQITRAGEQLEGITRSMGTILELTAQIATASEEQCSVTEDTNKNVIDINEVSVRTCQHARDTRAATDALSSQAQRLKSIVDHFRVS